MTAPAGVIDRFAVELGADVGGLRADLARGLREVEGFVASATAAASGRPILDATAFQAQGERAGASLVAGVEAVVRDAQVDAPRSLLDDGILSAQGRDAGEALIAGVAGAVRAADVATLGPVLDERRFRAEGERGGAALVGGLAARLSESEGEALRSLLNQFSENPQPLVDVGSAAAETLMEGFDETIADLGPRRLMDPADAAKVVDDAGKVGRDAGKKLVDEVKKEAKRLNSLGKDLQDIGGRASLFVTAPLIAIGGASVKLAEDADQSMDKLKSVFGGAAVSITRDLDALKGAIPNTSTQLREMAASVGEVLRPLGVAPEAARRMSVETVRLAGDLSALKDVPISQALEAIRAGIIGQERPLKALGVVYSDATVKAEAYRLGLAPVGAALSEAARAQATFSVIMSQSASAQGAAAREIGEVGTQLAFTRRNAQEASEALGRQLIPAVLPLATAFADVVGSLGKVDPALLRVGIGVGAVSAAFGPLVTAVGTGVRAFAALRLAAIAAAGTSATSGGLALLGARLAPGGPILAGLAVAGTLFYAFSQESKKATANVDDFMRTLVGKSRDDLLGLSADYARQVADLEQRTRASRAKLDAFGAAGWPDYDTRGAEVARREYNALANQLGQTQERANALAGELNRVGSAMREQDAAAAALRASNDALLASLGGIGDLQALERAITAVIGAQTNAGTAAASTGVLLDRLAALYGRVTAELAGQADQYGDAAGKLRGWREELEQADAAARASSLRDFVVGTPQLVPLEMDATQPLDAIDAVQARLATLIAVAREAEARGLVLPNLAPQLLTAYDQAANYLEDHAGLTGQVAENLKAALREAQQLAVVEQRRAEITEAVRATFVIPPEDAARAVREASAAIPLTARSITANLAVSPDEASVARAVREAAAAAQAYADTLPPLEIARLSDNSGAVDAATAASREALAAYRREVEEAAAAIQSSTLSDREKADALARLKELTDDAGAATQDLGRGLDDTIAGARGLVNVANATGAIGDSAALALNNMISLGDGIASVIEKGASLGSVLGVIGAGAALLSQVLSQSAGERERDAMIEQNTRAIERLTVAASGFGDGIADTIQANRAAVRLAEDDVNNIIRQAARVGQGEQRRFIDEQLREFGLTFEELNAIAEANGIDLLNDRGYVVAGTMEQLALATELAAQAAATYGRTFQDLTAQADAYARIFDVDGDAQASLDAALRIGRTLAPEIFDRFFAGIDTASAAGQAEIERRTREAYEFALTPEGAEFLKRSGFATIEEFVQWLLSVDRPLDDLADSSTEAAKANRDAAAAAREVAEQLTNVPTGFKIAAARFTATDPRLLVGTPVVDYRPEVPYEATVPFRPQSATAAAPQTTVTATNTYHVRIDATDRPIADVFEELAAFAAARTRASEGIGYNGPVTFTPGVR